MTAPRGAQPGAVRIVLKRYEATAEVGFNLLKVLRDPLGEKGVCAVAARDVGARQPILVEALLVTPKPSALYIARLKALLGHFAARSDMERAIINALVVQKAASVRAYAQSPPDLREQLLGLQTEFADPESVVAQSVKQAAPQLHEAALFAGKGDCKNEDGLFSGGKALRMDEIRRALTSFIVNAWDFYPEGCEAMFYFGSMMEHSCAPNVRLHIVMPKGDTSGKTWVGEWRTIRAIREGEAVCGNYLGEEEIALDYTARRSRLMRRMGFICSCSSCKEEAARSETPKPSPAVSVCNACAAISWVDPDVARITLALQS